MKKKMLHVATAMMVVLSFVGQAKAAESDDALKCFLIFDSNTKIQRDVKYSVTMIVVGNQENLDIQATLNGSKVGLETMGSDYIKTGLADFKGSSEGESMDLIGKATDGKNNAECKVTVKIYDQACESDQRQVIESRFGITRITFAGCVNR